MTTTTTTPAKLTKMGARLLELIGEGKLSFFDDGPTEGSGTWHTALTDEAAGAEGMSRTPHGVAAVAQRLVEQGMLRTLDGDDGLWVELTAEGAARAQELAGGTESDGQGEDDATPAGEVSVAPEPASEPTTTKGKTDAKTIRLARPILEHLTSVSVPASLAKRIAEAPVAKDESIRIEVTARDLDVLDERANELAQRDGASRGDKQAARALVRWISTRMR